MAKDSKNNIGKIGEDTAVKYLKQNGYSIETVNFSNEIGYRIGEIDIVAKDSETGEVVFFEVKTRQTGSSGPSDPESAISRFKYRKLSRIISKYLRQNRLEDVPHRIDAIAIKLDLNTKRARIRHLKYIYY